MHTVTRAALVDTARALLPATINPLHVTRLHVDAGRVIVEYVDLDGDPATRPRSRVETFDVVAP